MGVDLRLHDLDGEEVQWINWLRNPFGLEQWLVANTKPRKNDISISWLLKNYSGQDSQKMPRQLFFETVISYRNEVEALENSYFRFGVAEYQQFVEPLNLPSVKVFISCYRIPNCMFDGDAIMVPLNQYGHRFDLRPRGKFENYTEFYKDWYGQLYGFAAKYLLPENRFHCSI